MCLPTVKKLFTTTLFYLNFLIYYDTIQIFRVYYLCEKMYEHFKEFYLFIGIS